MGFYGNTSNISKGNFQFDKIYANRKEMDESANTDGVYVGRYVLVDYDKKSLLATQADEVRLSIDSENNPLSYDDRIAGFNSYYNYNLDLLPRKTDSNLHPAWMIIQLDGETTFHSGPSYRTPAYEFEGDGPYSLKTGDLVLLLGKRKCISYIPDDLKFTDAVSLEDYQDSELESIPASNYNQPIPADGTPVTEHYFVPEIWVCTGGRVVNWVSGGNTYFKTVATFEKSSIAYSTAVDMNNATLFNSNYSQDAVTYGNIGRGWDSTVWQKTTKIVGGKSVSAYVMIAELNSVVPTFDISVDAPTEVPIPPHFGADVSNVYYKMHVQPSWGMRVKSALKDYSIDKNTYPSDVSGPFLIDTKLQDGSVVHIGRRVKTDPVTGKTYIQDYIPVLDKNTGYVDEDVEDMPLAIFFNKSGFDPYKGYEYSSSKIKDAIYMRPSGTSNNEYNLHTESGELLQKNLPDTYELSIMLPSIGNMANSFWNLVYGENNFQDINGRSLWHVTNGAFADQGNPDSYLRNTEYRWNTYNGLRAIPHAWFDTSYYVGSSHTPKNYDEILAMKIANPSDSTNVYIREYDTDSNKNSVFKKISTIADFNEDADYTKLYSYSPKSLNSVTGIINTLHDLMGMNIRYTGTDDQLDENNKLITSNIKVSSEIDITDVTNPAQLQRLLTDDTHFRNEVFSDWDPTKIYFDGYTHRYYYKDKTYEYNSSTDGYELKNGKWYKAIPGSDFINLEDAKYYRQERMEYPLYSETNLTKKVANLPYFNYILAKNEDDYVEGANYYQIYNQENYGDIIAPLVGTQVLDSNNHQYVYHENGDILYNGEALLRYPTPLYLYNVGYEPGKYSYEAIGPDGQRTYTLDNDQLPSQPDKRYVEIVSVEKQDGLDGHDGGYLLYTANGFYRWDNKEGTLTLCRNANLKSALGWTNETMPDTDAEVSTASEEWNPLITVESDSEEGEEETEAKKIQRYVFMPNTALFQDYLHLVDSEEGQSVYVVDEDVPETVPVAIPPRSDRWDIVEEDGSRYLYIYKTANKDECIGHEELIDKIPYDNIIFKQDSYAELDLNFLNDRNVTSQDNGDGTYTTTYQYFETYLGYKYLCITGSRVIESGDTTTTEDVTDYLKMQDIWDNNYTLVLKDGEKQKKMITGSIGTDTSAATIHFNKNEAIQRFGVEVREFQDNMYYYHPVTNNSAWYAELRSSLLLDTGRNAFSESVYTIGGDKKKAFNGYWKLTYKTLDPELQDDDYEEINDNNDFRFFTLDRTKSYRYQDLDGNWIEEIISRTFPKQDIKYWTVHFIKMNKKVFQKGKYYIKDGDNFVLDTEPFDPNKTYYEYSPRYVESDTANIYPTGAIWNEAVTPVPDSITLGFREEVWKKTDVYSYVKENGSVKDNLQQDNINNLILRQKKMLRENDDKTRDRATVQGTINTLNDIIAKFDTLTPQQFVTVDEYGRVHSADWDTLQRDYIVNYGNGDIVDDGRNYPNRWIEVELNPDKDNPHFTIKHTSTSVPDTTTVSDKNTGATVQNPGWNNTTDDTLQLYTPIVDNHGHIVGSNTETVTLPYGFKTITTNGRVSNDNVNPLVAQENIVADNTQDTLGINSGNEWIKIETNPTNDLITISHDAKNTTTATATVDLSTETDGSTEFVIPVDSYDATNHFIRRVNTTYTLPNGYGKFTGDSGSSEATATHDTFSLTGDSWIQTTATKDNIAFAHIGPVHVDHVTVANETPGFDETFELKDWTFDAKGHQTSGGTHTIKIPGLELSINTNASSGNVLTGIDYQYDTSAHKGVFTKSFNNIGALALTGYNLNSNGSSEVAIAATDSLNTALQRLEYRINALNSNTTTLGTNQVLTGVTVTAGKITNQTYLQLGTAALKREEDFDTAGAATTVKNELIGSAADTAASNTITGAKRYADSLASNYDASGSAAGIQTAMEAKKYGADGSSKYTFDEMVAQINELKAKVEALENGE